MVGSVPVMALSEVEQRVIDLERTWWREPGTKQNAIRRDLGVSPAAYYAKLADLVTRYDALRYDPLVIRRLRRRNDARRRAAFEYHAQPVWRRPR